MRLSFIKSKNTKKIYKSHSSSHMLGIDPSAMSLAHTSIFEKVAADGGEGCLVQSAKGVLLFIGIAMMLSGLS